MFKTVEFMKYWNVFEYGSRKCVVAVFEDFSGFICTKNIPALMEKHPNQHDQSKKKKKFHTFLSRAAFQDKHVGISGRFPPHL